MLKLGGAKAFVDEVRRADAGLEKIKIKSVEIDRLNALVRYNFICDKPVSKESKEKILQIACDRTDSVFSTVEVTVKKIVSDSELVVNRVFYYVSANFPSSAVYFDKSDVAVEKAGDSVKVVITLTESGKRYFETNGVPAEIIRDLSGNFCDSFICELKGGKEEKEIEFSFCDGVYSGRIAGARSNAIIVKDIVVIDDPEKFNAATPVEDVKEAGNYTVCGRVLAVKEFESKKKTPFYVFEFSDDTGKMSGLYFPRAATLHKIKAIKPGDGIIAHGKSDYYREKLSFRIDKLNLCTIPEERRCEPPSEYGAVFPEAVKEVKEESFLAEKTALPEGLEKGVFVVFDLVTTGTDPSKDEITEIGAVKITGGEIKEQFHTPVNPRRPVPRETAQPRGIDDEALGNAPDFRTVIPDFYLFADGAALVAHNADTVVNFLKLKAKKAGYPINNGVFDTAAMARNAVPDARNFKLGALCERFGIKFTPQNALSGAFAAARLFIELVKLKKSL